MRIANSLHQKRNNKIHVCADFSTGSNERLKQYNFPLPCLFSKLDTQSREDLFKFIKKETIMTKFKRIAQEN